MDSASDYRLQPSPSSSEGPVAKRLRGPRAACNSEVHGKAIAGSLARACFACGRPHDPTAASSVGWRHIGDGPYWASLTDWAQSVGDSWVHDRSVLLAPLQAGECVCRKHDCVWHMYSLFLTARKKLAEGSSSRMEAGQPSPLGRFPTLASQMYALLDHVQIEGSVLDGCGSSGDAVSVVLAARGCEMGLLQMASMLPLACMSLFSRAQELQDCVIASPFTVGSTEDASTLSASLGCSNGSNGGFVVDWVGEVFVAETIHVTNGVSLSITGAGSGGIADGRNTTQLFVVDQGASLHLSDMALAHGNASFGGAINAFEASVSFSGNTSFISNSAEDDGGAIFANSSTISWDGDGTQFIFNFAGENGGAIGAHGASNVSWNGDGTQFSSNFAGDQGGAIYARESSVAWDEHGGEFISNFANSSGGGMYVTESTLSWEGDGALFMSNFAANWGGAIYVTEHSDVFWNGDGTQFRNNSAGSAGGAIFVDEFAFMSWVGDDTLFSFNSAIGNGGALEVVDDSNVSWHGDGTQFISNFANSSGGAIYVDESEFSWSGDGAHFISNSAGDGGGAMYVTEESEMFWRGDGSNFSFNSAVGNGGAISVIESEVLWTGYGAYFSFNSAANSGGAIFIDAHWVWNGDGSNFSFNSANDSGGAIFMHSYAELHWNDDDSHFSFNSAVKSGGAICVTGESEFFSNGNTTFSRNVAGENGGAMASAGNFGDYSAQFYGGTFIENSARHGGALHFSSAFFNFSQASFTSNSASGGGGAAVLDRTTDDNEDQTVLPTSMFTACNFSDNMSESGGAIQTLAGELQLSSCFFEGNSADEGGAMLLAGPTVVRETSFLSNSASTRGFAVAAIWSPSITASSFEGNQLYCAAGSYRKDEEKEGLTARYEVVCLDCPDWDECVGCSIARGNVVSTCEASLEHTQAKENGSTLETLSIAEGYWRATNDTDNILACYNADACNGGQTGAEDYCAQGHTGPYCAACETDYSPSLSYSCMRCSSSRRQGLMAATVIAALVVACVVVAIVRYLVSTPPEEERSVGCFHRRVLRAIPLQALKILVVVWQILIQFADAAGITYPGVYQDFLSAIDVVNFDLGSVLAAGCLWSNMDFHDRLLVNTLGPLVVVGLLGITYRVAIYRGTASGDAVVEKIRHRHQTVLLLVTFLIYSSVSSTVFRTFACETLDDGAEYLRADYNIQCTDTRHKNFAVYAGIMIFVYPVGIPLLYAILLFQRRDVLADDDVDKTKAHSISSLWEPYRSERFYYEVVECGRRIMLTGVVVFIFPNDAAQLAITMLSAFFFLAIFEMLRPYESEHDMWLCRAGHVIVFLSMFYLLSLKVDVSGERGESQAVYGGVLVACHMVLVLAIVVEVVIICCASRRKRVEDEVGSPPASLPQLRTRSGSDEAPYFESVPPRWKSLTRQTSVSAKTGPTRSVDGSALAVGRP